MDNKDLISAIKSKNEVYINGLYVSIFCDNDFDANTY